MKLKFKEFCREKRNEVLNEDISQRKNLVSRPFRSRDQRNELDSAYYSLRSEGNKADRVNSMSEDEQIEAVKRDSSMIRLIKNPSEAVQLAAVENDHFAISFIRNPADSVKKLVQAPSTEENEQITESVEEENEFPPEGQGASYQGLKKLNRKNSRFEDLERENLDREPINEGRKDETEDVNDEELTTISAKDMQAAEEIRDELFETFDLISERLHHIRKKMSSFSEPGLTYSFISAIHKGLHQSGFDVGEARNTLEDYYNREIK